MESRNPLRDEANSLRSDAITLSSPEARELLAGGGFEICEQIICLSFRKFSARVDGSSRYVQDFLSARNIRSFAVNLSWQQSSNNLMVCLPATPLMNP